VERVRTLQAEKNDQKIGYNVITDEYVNMIEAGITDPVKVTRSAVANACSIAGMILTTEALISDKPEKESPMPNPGMGMDY
jgi:chaperonin GroEL